MGPIKVVGDTVFMYVKHGNMFIVAVASGNAQAAMAFQFLHSVVTVLKCKYEPDQGGVIWKLRRFPGDTEYFMSGEVEMMATMGGKAWSRPPITMDFQVPMFAASGLHVRFLKVFEKSNYQTIKWVRYITKAGQYQHRI